MTNKHSKVLFLSNGHGEDLIACAVIKELQKKGNVDIYALPLVGRGLAYSALKGIKIIGPQKEMLSGGFIKSVSVFFKDIVNGLLFLHYKQVKNARKIKYDLVVSVGDFFPFILSALFIKSDNKILIATAKSDLFEPHFAIEKWFFRKYKVRVFARDQVTADNLLAEGVLAEYAGNVMMDLIDISKRQVDDSETVVGILPGSRFEAYRNYETVKQVITHFPKEWTFHVAVSSHLQPERFNNSGVRQKIIFTDFSDIINKASCVIGLAGTANEQCIGCGIPVFCFPAKGPQTTRERFIQQRKLLKGLIEFVDSRDSGIIAKQILKKMKDFKFLQKVQKEGPLVMGKHGAAGRITREIECILESSNT
ncbi:MAG: hypothetical protein PHV30_03795 [Candidatus Margulisbacteria bacterium]|nr:hypothetical protein [Candidatus Margulisiibacteriota bacterium]